MPRTRPPYPQKFRSQVVELARNGRSPKELAEEFEPTETTESARTDRLLRRKEIRQLRKKLRTLQQERDILAKAAAWFAQETNSSRRKSSDS